MDMNYFIANASGTLNDKQELIKLAFNKVVKAATKSLSADKIDIIFIDAPENTIEELGIGGYTATKNLIYISLNPKFNINTIDLESGMLHEIHHAIRWRKPGFGNTLAEVLITEGLATLFEEETTGKTPIYAKVKYNKKCEELAKKEMNNDKFNYDDWFVSGNKDIPKWFGYTYGYLCTKELSKNINKTSSQLVNYNSFKFQLSASKDIILTCD